MNNTLRLTMMLSILHDQYEFYRNIDKYFCIYCSGVRTLHSNSIFSTTALKSLDKLYQNQVAGTLNVSSSRTTLNMA